MNLTEQQAKQIIAQVHDDLKLDHSDKYPIYCAFHSQKDEGNLYKADYWGGGYDYRDPEAVGDEYYGMYTEWIITIDDEKGEAIQFAYYTGRWEIKLNKNGKYKRVKKL